MLPVSDGSLYQTITIPAISVWSVDALANGDVVCGSSDGFVRVFTRSSERVADAEEIRVSFDSWTKMGDDD